MGSPIRLLGESKDDVLVFDEFGMPTIEPSINQPFGFTSYQFDKISGLQYAQARYYNPALGRFGAEDTHWHPGNMLFGDGQDSGVSAYIPNISAIVQSSNLYSYCTNNPIVFVDPLGLRTYDLGRGWTARIERGQAGNDYQKHVHVYRHNQHWSQNDDGSPHDRGNNSPGNPPNRVINDLKNTTGWDWTGNQNNWIDQIVISPPQGEFFMRTIEFPDGTTATFFPNSTFSAWPNRPPSINELIRLFLHSLNSSGINPGLIPPLNPFKPGLPVPKPVPMPIQVFVQMPHSSECNI